MLLQERICGWLAGWLAGRPAYRQYLFRFRWTAYSLLTKSVRVVWGVAGKQSPRAKQHSTRALYASELCSSLKTL